jgi:sporulation protein YlmC with PRC-barrel domain
VHVENTRGESIGRTEDVVVDVRDGRVLAVVVSCGGFLGLRDRLVAVPLAAMTFDALGRKFVLNADRERLKEAPSFDRKSWPDLNRAGWAEEIQSFYRFPPYWE